MIRLAFIPPLVLLVSACEMRMWDQDRLETWEQATAEHGRLPPEQTIARGDLAYLDLIENRPPMTRELLARGRTVYERTCALCHGRYGDGEGIIVRRGFPAPPSYHTERLRNADPSYFVEIITEGYGAMYPYANRIEPTDRWAVAAYIQALQRVGEAREAEAGEGS